MTREEGIKAVRDGGGHVVILGAGASIAATLKDPEKNNKQLPSMDNFIEIVGLKDIVDNLPKELQADNFEELFSKMHEDNPASEEIKEIEKRVYNYFDNMELPSNPTLYDYLVLSLRPRDLIATFNWDPFLFQAIRRNRHVAAMPNVAFLHGNAAVGYSREDNIVGKSNEYTVYGNQLEPTRLLYPITKKDYNSDDFIVSQWDTVKEWLKKDSGTVRATVFGYGAPKTDVEAMKLLSSAWGTTDERSMEQFEVIDIRPEENVIPSWKKFIHTHHYNYGSSYFESVLSKFPRRTTESYFHAYFPKSPGQAFQEQNPIPEKFDTFEEMWSWFRPLIDAESEWRKKSKTSEK